MGWPFEMKLKNVPLLFLRPIQVSGHMLMQSLYLIVVICIQIWIFFQISFESQKHSFQLHLCPSNTIRGENIHLDHFRCNIESVEKQQGAG